MRLDRPLIWLSIGLITLYRYIISPLLGQRCRYDPSCSAYMHQALLKHGFLKGILLGLRRLTSCHPWGGHGYDPVPEQVAWKHIWRKPPQKDRDIP